MSIVGEDDRLDDENVEYNHRNESSDDQTESGGEAIALIRDKSKSPENISFACGGIFFADKARQE